jgi:DNA-3-methyladenine glycosylase II
MSTHTTTVAVEGPWSLATSRRFWEGFSPNALARQDRDGVLHAVFRVERDWTRAEVDVEQCGSDALITLDGDGDLDAAATQVTRFLALDVDGRDWPKVGERDAVIADAQARLPGLRPCGFYSPYEAAAWSVLSQRIRIVQAAKLRDNLVRAYGDAGAFPTPERLRSTDLDLPGRKSEYLHAVADAALEGRLDGAALRAMPAEAAMAQTQQIKGLGPFAAELVVIRGANAPDVAPREERRLAAEVTERYGPDTTLSDVADSWRPYRTWASVHLRVLREERTREIAG